VLQPRSKPDEIRAALGTTDHVRLLAVTDENDTWAIGDHLVAKFPRSPECAEKVPFELALYPLVRERLGALVPEIIDRGEFDGLPFVIYERARGLQGQSMDGTVVRPGLGLATDLGEILASLHSITVADARKVGAMDRRVWLDELRLAPETIAVATDIVGERALLAFLEAKRPDPIEREALCHTDMKGEHLFLDTTCTRVERLIDWADAEVCDPAKDYAGFTIWLGPTFTREVVSVGEEDDGTLAERAIFLGRADLLDYWNGVVTGAETGSPALLTAQLRAAFSD
jgi:aminoglycoside phosphotransferase (APT) family kinase protein